MSTADPTRKRQPPYILIALVALLLWGFANIADEVTDGETTAFDTAVTSIFRTAGDPETPIGPMWLQEAVRDITALGSFSVLGLIVVVTVAYLFFSGHRLTALFVAVSVVGGTLLSTGMKVWFDRPRPDVEAVARVFTASFPSGHAMLAAVTFMTLGLLLAESAPGRRMKAFWLTLSITLALLVGISRLYMGVHYPTDVLAGWCIGAAWALVCWAIYSELRRRRVARIGT
ncbi:MAG: phosphatase PAP2 family protein [Devosia sp.]